ncbi:hypothetical protein AB0L13_16590 [Saccharopolyspora shandongensis]|uniref:hypothetical protein n=1 Tax=Saccharopolyspora shandongensis TaxID=418495 RepID=UPI003435552F
MKPLNYRFRLGESEWDLDFHSITVDESIELRKLTGLRWLELCGDFDQGDALATKAFFWLARRKSGEKVTFDGEAMNFTWSNFRRELIPPALDESADDATEPAPDPTAATSKTSRKR